MTPPPRRVIIDSDPSAGIPAADVDDVLALAYAVGEPELELAGVTVVAGNVELPEGVASALQVLEALGRPDVPVVAGAAGPLVRDRREVAEFLRVRRDDALARALWRDVPRPVPARPPASGRAAEFIANAVTGAPGAITLVAIGPLTNVALALLLEPQVARSVREIVLMGGHAGGGDPGAGAVEFNLANDPEAAHVVFRSGAPVVMVGLDVTTRTHLTLENLHAATASGTAAASFVRRLAEPWIRLVGARRGLPGCWLHDPLAVVAAVDRDVIGTERVEAGVEIRGEATAGLTLVRRPGRGPGLRPLPGGTVDLAVSVDAGRFLKRFLAGLARALGA